MAQEDVADLLKQWGAEPGSAVEGREQVQEGRELNVSISPLSGLHEVKVSPDLQEEEIELGLSSEGGGV